MNKINDKFDVRLTDVEEQMLKLGKSASRTEEQMNRQENGMMKGFEDLREDLKEKTVSVEVKFQRRLKETETSFERGNHLIIRKGCSRVRTRVHEGIDRNQIQKQ